MLIRNKHAVIKSDKYLDAVVEHCPRLTNVIVENYRISTSALRLLFQLPIESFECLSVITCKVTAPYLKKIRVAYIEPFIGCKLLEDISVNKIITSISSGFPHGLFPNLKELEVLYLTDVICPHITKIRVRDNQLHLLAGLNLKKLIIDETTYGPMPAWTILTQFKLKELVTWYFDNNLIKDMPLERLTICENSTVTPDITVKHSTLKHLELTRRCVIELDTPNLYHLSLNQCEFRTRVPDSVRILHVDTAMICPYINCNLHTLYITTFVTPSLLEQLPQTLRYLTITPMEHAYFDNFPYLPNLCLLTIFDQFTLTEKTLIDIARMPITNLYLDTASITDSNIHHLAAMPLNYLSIQIANITVEGVKKIKHLPLRYLVLPPIPTHHFLQM